MNTDNLHHFPIIVEVDEDGMFIVSCPSIKGCHSYGSDIEEAMLNIKEAIIACTGKNGADESKGLNRFVGFREVIVAL